MTDVRRPSEAQTVRCFACASQQPEAACSHWVGIGWSCTDRKACRARRATPDDPPTPTQALDGLFNGAVSGIGGVRAAKLFNIVRAAMSEPYDGSFDRLGDIIDEGFGIQAVMSRSEKLSFLEKRLCEQRRAPHFGPLGNEVSCEWSDRHVARLETSVKEATDESERLREEWAAARDGEKYSRDEHVAALEAMEFSTRTATIEECARWLEESEDLDLVAGRMRKELREVKP